MIIATAGHVDHGKTALVRALTGKDTDTLAEERRRGLTINLGFAYLDAEPQRIGFVDVPGHERFMHNMLAGVAGIDAVILVVAADEGVMAQTREHLRVMDLLGLQRGLVVVTKTDRVDAETLDIVESELRDLMRNTFLENADVMQTSVISGEGLASLRERLETIATTLPPRPTSGNFRLAIDRIFHLDGAGLIATGTVHAGCIEPKARVAVMPGGRLARVRGIFSEERQAELAAAGHRCALNLTGLAREHIKRGDWLTLPGAAQASQRLDIRLRVASDGQPIRHWTPVHVFHGAGHTTGRIALLEGRTAAPGVSVLAQLVCDAPLVCVHGDRLVLRNQSADATVGGGRVLDVFAPRRGRAGEKRLHRLRLGEAADARRAIETLLADSLGPVALDELRLNFNLDDAQTDALLSSPVIGCLEIDDRVMLTDANGLRELRDAIQREIQECHVRDPQDGGLRLSDVCARQKQNLPQPMISAVLRELVSEGLIRQRGAYYCLPGFSPRLTGADAVLWTRVEAALDAAGVSPPVVATLATTVGVDPVRLDALLSAAERIGLVHRVASNRVFSARQFEALLGLFTDMAAGNGQPVGTGEFRDRSGLGRNLAIAVLEHFDTRRLTRRIGAGRVLVRASE